MERPFRPRSRGHHTTAAGGAITWSASADLREGTLAAQVRVAPEPLRDAETMPVLTIRHEGTLGAPERSIETE